MSDSVTVFETRDPIELEAAESYLRAHGIDARALGTRNAPLIGAGQHIFGLRIEVAKADEAAAREALAALASGVEGVAAHDLPDELSASDEPREPTRKTWVRAAPSAFILPGGAHLYAGRGWSALVIACFELASFVWLLSGRWEPFVLGVFMLAGGILVDLVGGLRALRRPAPGVALQLAAPLPFFAAIVAAGMLVAPHITEPEPQDAAPRMYIADPFPLTTRDDLHCEGSRCAAFAQSLRSDDLLRSDGSLELAMRPLDAPGYQTWWQGAEFDWRHAGVTLTLTELTQHTDDGERVLGSISGLPVLGELVHFLAQREGSTNVSFNRYEVGQTYCVGDFVSWDARPLGLGKVLHLRLVDRMTLDLVVVDRPTCGPPPYDLTGATRYLR